MCIKFLRIVNLLSVFGYLINMSNCANIMTNNITLNIEPVFNETFLLNVTYEINSTILPIYFSFHRANLFSGSIENYTLDNVENLTSSNNSITGILKLDHNTYLNFQVNIIDRGTNISNQTLYLCESSYIFEWMFSIDFQSNITNITNITSDDTSKNFEMHLIGTREMFDHSWINFKPRLMITNDKLYFSGSLSKTIIEIYDNSYGVNLSPMGFIGKPQIKHFTHTPKWIGGFVNLCSGGYTYACSKNELDRLQYEYANCPNFKTSVIETSRIETHIVEPSVSEVSITEIIFDKSSDLKSSISEIFTSELSSTDMSNIKTSITKSSSAISTIESTSIEINTDLSDANITSNTETSYDDSYNLIILYVLLSCVILILIMVSMFCAIYIMRNRNHSHDVSQNHESSLSFIESGQISNDHDDNDNIPKYSNSLAELCSLEDSDSLESSS